MDEVFVKKIYETIIQDGEDTYIDLFNNTQIDKHTVGYWKNALDLYQSFGDKQKEIFHEIIKHIMIDTVSSVFGILDGSSSLRDGNYDINVIINGESSENELQDTFLAYIEEIGN